MLEPPKSGRVGFFDRHPPAGHPADVLLPATVDAAERELSGAQGPAREARFRGLVERHYDFVWRSLRRLGVPAADVDDAAQEVFIVAARRLDDFTEDRERAFLFGTASRVCSTRRRTARRHPEQPSDAVDEQLHADLDPEALAELAQARPLLQGLLEELDTEFRSVFILAELEELAVRDIAGVLGIPEGTVASRLRTARARFKEGIKRLEAKNSFARRVR